jgi:hypothetical protein
MAANALTYNAIGQLVTDIVQQATGKQVIAPVNTSDFVAVANIGLQAGYDNLMGAISQVLSRTVVSNRPYTRKFQGLEADSIRWGNHVRKINYIDRAWDDGSRLPITNGVAVDQQAPVLDDVVQTNFYGQNDYEIQWTMYANQLDVAFRGPDEFASFISGKLQNISDMVEQKHESLARMCLANLVAGIYTLNNSSQIVHLLTEYNAATGLTLTATTVMQPANFPGFIKWAYARIAAVSDMMTERSIIHHLNITGKEVNRHTPKSMQRVFMYAPSRHQVDARVLADAFHDSYLYQSVNETVNFWQDITTPDSIDVVPTYMDATGALVTPMSHVQVSDIFAVIVDPEAIGYTVVNERSTSAPYNGKGEYQNFWLKFTDRYWNDFTENAVVFLLD